MRLNPEIAETRYRGGVGDGCVRGFMWFPRSRPHTEMSSASHSASSLRILACTVNKDFHENFVVEGNHRTVQQSSHSKSYLDHVPTCTLTLPGSHHVDKHIRIGSGPLCLCVCAECR